MLERYGIVTRETVLAEGVPGGFSSLYGELSNLEMLGTARRGYFVEGLGGAQFALAGAVERLRALPQREDELPAPRRHRPGPALRRRAALAEAGRGPAARPRPPAPTCCCATATRRLRRARRQGHRPPGRARGRGAGRGDRAARRGRARAADPEARDRARRRRAGDRLGLEEQIIAAGFTRQPRKLVAVGLSRVAMPEGDTIHRAARRMNAALGGRELELADAPNPRSPLHGRAGELEGAELERAEARGKHLLVHFSGDLVVHSHLGMNGRWWIAADGRLPHGRPWLRLASGRAIAAQTGRQDPARWSSESRARNDPALAQLGPDPLRPGFDVADAAARACARPAPGASSATRCSTSGSSPGSATRSGSRPASRPRISPWRAGRRALDAASSSWSSPRASGSCGPRSPRGRRPRAIYRATAAACPRLRRPDRLPRARATPTAPPTGARRCQPEQPCRRADAKRYPSAMGQDSIEL